ncbi:hypothetical protein NLG97_g5867 [Lecanicillium saksenae]|uniref:Uncharacterized protein n=1 Tax=Lecanicillium saksenae TaxID=468837 RepID=A0ACC1QR79_9HYPO|nr:hypothetical protein NLG97_g5867 [Lecanicillium saksenae]
MPTSKTPARTGKKPKEQPIQTGWFTIRRILDERRIANRIQYLVDWDDDINTGETYEPTWAWSADVTALAKREWKNRKAAGISKPPPARSETPAAQSSQGDQSPRPANFRQLERTKSNTPARSSSTDSSVEAGPARKRLRYSPSLSAEPVPSIVSAPSPSSATELSEIYEREEGAAEFVVGISKAPNFDPTEFFSVAGSQSTSYPSQSVSELEEQDRQLALSSQISARTVPDSQEYSGQSLSTASQQQALVSLVSSLPESDYAVIPDSLEREEICIAESSEEGLPQEQIPESSIQAEPETNSAIPSHQQDAKEQSLASVAEFDSTEDRAKQPPKSPQVTTGDFLPASLIEVPRFLSQVEAHEPSTFLSSSPRREQVSPPSSPAAVRFASQNVHQASQDAQVVNNFFDTVLEKVTDSNKTETTSDQEQSKDPNSLVKADGNVRLHLQIDTNMADDVGDLTGTQRSAVDELNELFTLNPPSDVQILPQGDASLAPSAEIAGQEAITAQEISQPNPPTIDGSLDPSQWHPPTVESVDDPDLASSAIAFNTQPEVNLQMLMPMHPHDEQPGTISPSDILESSGPVLVANPDPTVDTLGVIPAAVFGSSAEPFTVGQQSPGSPSSSTTSDDPVLMQHIITLPFQASLRPQYDDILLARRKQVKDFSEVFSSEEYVEPDPALVGKIDGLFIALRNLCDYPQDVVGTTLSKLSPREQVKYACDANPKFCFVYELLQGIETNIRVLVVAQSVELLRLLSHVAEALEIDCAAHALESLNTEAHGSACNVTLALPTEDFDIDEFEVVIGFDHSFGSSPVATALSSEGQAVRPPMVLTLVTTHSIEHIDQQLPEELGPLERRNALLAGIVNARKLTSDPDRGYPEPHEVASMFCDFLNGAVEGVLWEPMALPEDVLDIYVSSQSQQPAVAEAEGSRKRKLDDDNEEEAKRVRTIPKQSTISKEEVPLPDDVRWLLDSVAAAAGSLPGSDVSIKVPLSVLQAVAEKTSELERRLAASDMDAQYKSVIDSLDARVKEYERTSNKTYQAYRAAVEERTKFEREKKKTDAALLSAQEAALKESSKLQSKIAELEATVSRLTSTGEGEAESPLAASEKLLKQAQENVKKLEKRLENTTQDGEYAKNAYQDASNAASRLQNENKELREQNEKLVKRTSDNVTKIHEIQNASMSKTYLKQIEELKIQMREREAELDRAREELRQARTRRETRQASVPRSPRMGLMSPRTGRPYANPASRGTSRRGRRRRAP